MLRLRQLLTVTATCGRAVAALGWLAHRWFLMGCGEGERDTRAPGSGDMLGSTVQYNTVQYRQRGNAGHSISQQGQGTPAIAACTWIERAAVTSC